MSSIPNLPQDEEPYFLPDPSPLPIPEDGPLLGATRASVSRARKRDLTALWAVLGLGGVTLAGYAVKLALEPAPAVAVAEPPALATVAAPAHAPILKKSLRRPPIGTLRPAAPAPMPVERVVEKDEVKKAEEPPMDSEQAFESESQFDRTQRADAQGRPRRSFENPAHGPVSNFENPRHGYVSRMAPRPDRPNVPDPSFAAEDAAQPAAKGPRR